MYDLNCVQATTYQIGSLCYLKNKFYVPFSDNTLSCIVTLGTCCFRKTFQSQHKAKIHLQYEKKEQLARDSSLHDQFHSAVTTKNSAYS